MKLFTHELSPFSAKIRIALDEKKLPLEEVALPISRNAILERPAELQRLNPRGQVPTLVDGDVELFDSTVILEYLEDRYPDPPLYPERAAARARARLLEDQGDHLMNTCIGELINEVYRKPDPATRDQARIAQHTAEAHKAFDWLEHELGGRDWFGDAFGAADISLFLPVSFAVAFGAAPTDEHPKLRAWLQRASERPSLKRETQAMTAALQSLPD